MEMPHYGTETHGYCRKCNRRIFAGIARPIEKDGKLFVELNCPLHGKFQVEEDSLHNLSGYSPKKQDDSGVPS